MTNYTGKSIFQKVAIGKVLYYEKKENIVKRARIENVKEEIQRFEAAKVIALGQIDRIYQKALKEVGEENAAVFEVHMMMLEDDDYLESIYNIIRGQEVNAEYAVAVTGDNFADMFSQMDDEYMKARAADVKDISERLVAILTGNAVDMAALDEPVILAADDLAPSETVQMDKSKIIAFVTKHGSSNSHTAILARTMNIPAVIGVEVKKEWNGKTAIVDGYTGTVILEPDEECLDRMKKKMEEEPQSYIATIQKEAKPKFAFLRGGSALRMAAAAAAGGLVSFLAALLLL